ELTLITRADRVTPAYPRGASASLARALRQRNVHIVTSCPVARVEQDAVVAEDGRRFAFDLLVAAIGLAPPPLLRESGLDVDDEGGLRVDGTLRSVSDPRIFGTGDCISLEGCRLPRLGVFGVREAPILLHNLLASFTGQRLCTYRPQRRWLTILNLGRGEALAVWGPCHWRSRASLRLKDWIDRRFLQQYQREIATLRC
ncbi:MAG TPA: FAD-dependent oxidoreductase, partial [Phycisphaeraceae bacterium]